MVKLCTYLKKPFLFFLTQFYSCYCSTKIKLQNDYCTFVSGKFVQHYTHTHIHNFVIIIIFSVDKKKNFAAYKKVINFYSGFLVYIIPIYYILHSSLYLYVHIHRYIIFNITHFSL